MTENVGFRGGKIPPDNSGIGDYINKITKEMIETEEEFIFKTISPFVDSVVQKVVTKKELQKAVTMFYGNRMTGNEYQHLAARTINKDLNLPKRVYHSLHGMVGEVGEIHSIFQKQYQGHDVDGEHLKKEVGDLLWFIAEFCTAHGWKLEDIMKMNIKKLEERFPDGFEADRSINRKEGDI